VSDDAGSYLCNYLCWRASEAASRSGGPRVVTFVHVPPVGRVQLSAWRPNPASLTLDNLIDTGEALVLAALVALRAAH
jgi:pyroglutamyl-peptidase